MDASKYISPQQKEVLRNKLQDQLEILRGELQAARTNQAFLKGIYEETRENPHWLAYQSAITKGENIEREIRTLEQQIKSL